MPKRIGGLKGQKEYAEKLISEGKSLEEIIKLTGLKKNTIQHYKTEWNQRKKMPRMPKADADWEKNFRAEWSRETRRVKDLYGF